MQPVTRHLAFFRRSSVMTALMMIIPVVLVFVHMSVDTFDAVDVMVTVPPLAAIFLRPMQVLSIGAASVVSVLVAQGWQGGLWQREAVSDVITVAVIIPAAVAASHLRVRRERNLAQARWVAAAAQHTLVQPLPSRMGRLAISSLYVAAEEEASIGGDLYAAALAGGEPRILVADAQGKGLAATQLAGYLMASFRRAARGDIPLNALGSYLDRDLSEELVATAEWEAGASHRSLTHTLLEGFITAVIVEFADNRIRLANCGHPPPLLLSREGTVRELGAAVSTPPLGLGNLAPQTAHIDEFDFEDGDTLLLYTDGVTEARNRAGEFYALHDRLAAWTSLTLEDLLAALRADLRDHAGARLADDVVVVAIRQSAERLTTGARDASAA
jgi:serine phosphatase RsbU (regulator of sigma subunit)